MSAQHKIDPQYQPAHPILNMGTSRNLSLTRTYPQVSLFLSPVEQCQLNKLKEQYRKKLHYLKVDLDIFVSVLISNQIESKILPFTAKQLQHLEQQKSLYEQRYQVEFIDLASFISHVADNHLQKDNRSNSSKIGGIKKNSSHAEITQSEFVDTCQTIGNIADSNCHYTAGLTAKLAALNKPMQDITLGELIALDKDFTITFNQMMEV